MGSETIGVSQIAIHIHPVIQGAGNAFQFTAPAQAGFEALVFIDFPLVPDFQQVGIGGEVRGNEPARPGAGTDKGDVVAGREIQPVQGNMVTEPVAVARVHEVERLCLRGLRGVARFQAEHKIAGRPRHGPAQGGAGGDGVVVGGGLAGRAHAMQGLGQVSDTEVALDQGAQGIGIFQFGEGGPAGRGICEIQGRAPGVGGAFPVVVLEDELSLPAIGQVGLVPDAVGPGDFGIGAVVAVQGFAGNAGDHVFGLEAAQGHGPGFLPVSQVGLVQGRVPEAHAGGGGGMPVQVEAVVVLLGGIAAGKTDSCFKVSACFPF